MEDKIIQSGESVTEKFIRGVDKVDAMVGGTLGPYGRNRIIQRKYRSPLVTNDGVTVARHMYLQDPVEDLAAQTLVEISMKTNETVGDGTTTSVVIGAELVRSCMKKAQEDVDPTLGGGGAHPMQMAKEIWAELPHALRVLDMQRRTEDMDGGMLDSVIATSLENLEYGKTLADMMRTVGKDGYVNVEDNWGTKYGIETEVITGMRFLGTYASPYLATSANKKEAVWEDACVLVTNEKIDSITTFKTIFAHMKAAGKRKLVVIGGYSENTSPYDKEVIKQVARAIEAIARGGPMEVMEVLLVKAPSLTSDELEDVAVFCDAKFFNKNLGESVISATLPQLGYAKKIVVDEDNVNVVGGRGDTKQRIELLKGQMEREKDAMFKHKTEKRIASLAAGVGVIRVGAATEQERTYLKYKLEDAVHAARAAMEEGVVQGGGLALKAIADEFGEAHILYKALRAPYERIRANAGMDIEVPDTVVDPHKVVRLALTNACSAAAALISSDGAIADRKMTVLDYFEKKLGKLNPAEDDFRDAKNQDLGRGGFVD